MASSAAEKPAAGASALDKGKTARSEDAARARLHRCAGRLYRGLRQGRPSHARPALSGGDGALAQRYPDDDEAQIALAITLNVAASPADKTYAKQLQGAAILEPIFRRQPIIPASRITWSICTTIRRSPTRGSTRRSATPRSRPRRRMRCTCPRTSSPASGYWKESIASKVRPPRRASPTSEPHDQLHGMDYLVYAHLQLAQDTKARAVVDEMTKIQASIGGTHRAFRPCRQPGGTWWIAATGKVRPTSGPSDQIPLCGCNHLFRPRARRCAGRRFSSASSTSQSSPNCATSCRTAKDAYWTEQVDIQRQVANAWVLHAEGKRDDALKLMSAAAEQKTRPKSPSSRPVPWRRHANCTERCCSTGMAKEAIAAFEATLEKEPNRLGATLGAAKAAEEAGDASQARQYYAKAVALAQDADPVRPELAAARAFLAKNSDLRRAGMTDRSMGGTSVVPRSSTCHRNLAAR